MKKNDAGTLECPFDGMSEIVFGITADEREILLKYVKLAANYDINDEEKEELEESYNKLCELKDSFIEKIKNAETKNMSSTGTHIYPSNINDYKYMIVSYMKNGVNVEYNWQTILFEGGFLYSVNQEEKITVFKATDVQTDNVANPKTADLNIIYAIAGICLFMGTIIISAKRIKKLNKVSR